MLSRIETGRTQPSIATLQRILEGLGAEIHVEVRATPSGDDGRERQRSLWLNRAVAGEIARDPDRAIAVARDNIARWRTVHGPHPSVVAALDRWEEIIGDGIDVAIATLTGQSEEAEDLRQNSPFAGVLSPEDRAQALTAFRTWWQSRQVEQHVPPAAAR